MPDIFGSETRDNIIGSETVEAGGTADHLAVFGGGLLTVFGTVASNVTISSGGVENVSSGGLTSGVLSSGTAVLGTLNVLSGARAAFFGVSSGGLVNVSAGASASRYTVSSGGTVNVLGIVTSFETILTGGVENISSGGVATGLPNSSTLVSGGTVNVSSGGTLLHFTDVAGGTTNISAGGSGGFFMISGGGTLNVAGIVADTSAVDAAVFSGGVENVLSGGLASGGVGSGTTLSGGILNVQRHGAEQRRRRD